MNAATRNYAIVTAAYWGFTLTDGALRMLVLLHFYRLATRPSPWPFCSCSTKRQASQPTSSAAGWPRATALPACSRWGLSTQILGFLMLSALSPDWAAAWSVAWVVLAQGVCGVAKDLTKTASKSAIKATAGEASGQLFRWVAWFTGSKNAMERRWFLSRRMASSDCWVSSRALVDGRRARSGAGGRGVGGTAHDGQSQGIVFCARAVCPRTPASMALAAARVALFGARDVWFVVGVPVFLYSAGWTFTMVGAFLALWTIGYGLVQAAAPQVVARSDDGLSREVPAARAWSAGLALVPVVLALAVMWPVNHLDTVVVVGLGLFGVAFAINSSVHSYLVLAYAGSEKAAEDVGFYYAANALGRFIGTLLSGLLYQWGGLLYALLGSAFMLLTCWLITRALPVRAVKALPQGDAA